jgi:hypothetical protein
MLWQALDHHSNHLKISGKSRRNALLGNAYQSSHLPAVGSGLKIRTVKYDIYAVMRPSDESLNSSG